MASTIDQLLAGLQGLITRLANLLPAMTTTNTHLANITAPQPPPPDKPLFKPKDPAPYDGNPNRVVAFIQEIESYFKICKITDVELRVHLALGYIQGGNKNHATTWSDAMRNQITERDDQIEIANNTNVAATAAGNQAGIVTVPAKRFTIWKNFVAEFNQQFGLLNDQMEAVDGMRMLEQGNMTCEEYVTVFNTYYIRSGFSPIAGLCEFKRGLNKGLRQKLLNTFPLPDNNPDGTINIDNWVVRAAQIDRQYRLAQHEDRANKPTNTNERNDRRDYYKPKGNCYDFG